MAPIIEIDKKTLNALGNLGIKYREIPETSLKTPSFDKSQFVLLEGRDYGDENKYDDCLVSMARNSYSPEMDEIGKRLDCNVQNTGKDSLGREFIGDITWDEAVKLNLLLGGKTPTLRQFVDFLKLLKSGKAYDGNGKKVDSKQLENIFNDITQVKSPWRAEWIDANFKYNDNKLYLAQSHVLDANGNLTPQYIKPLDECLMEYRTPGINLEQWIQNPTIQGLPKKDSKKGDLYYWSPNQDNDSVARFDAGVDGVLLGCDRNRSYRYSGRGVRIVFDK
jgi:hypothetical protein